MFKFNDKLVLKVDGEYMPVTCAREQISPKSKSLWVSPCVGPNFWAKLSELITLEEYVAIKASTAPTPELTPINLANPQEFADALAKLESAEAIEELCDRLCDWLFTEGQKYTPKSRSNKLAAYSKLVKELPVTENTTGFYQIKQDGSQWLRHLYYKYTGIADTNWAEVNQQASQKVVEDLANQKPLDAERYEQCVGKLLASEQIWEIGAGLIAASGRRPIEIVINGEFEVDGNGLKFGGQAKKRNEDFEDYYIPLIGCTLELFVKKLKGFRESHQVKNHLARVEAGEFAEGKEADNIRIQINRLGIVPSLAWILVGKSAPTCSDLRAAWVTIVEARFKDNSKYSLLYRSEILGHKLNVGNIPALNYSRYAVDNSDNSQSTVGFLENWAENVLRPDGLRISANLDGGSETSPLSESVFPEKISQVAESASPTMEPPASPAKQSPLLSELSTLPVDEQKFPTENVDAAAPSKNIDATIPQAARHEFDFYETPPWLTLLALTNVPLSGTIGECCVGHGAIASILQMANFKIWTNDIDTAKSADCHSNATLPESWQQFPAADWIFTNPPYADMSAPIVKNAYAYARKGIVMILRQNWIEGCDDRRDFLKAHPPTLAISVPRYCYRKGKNGSWATDQCPTWIYVWDKANKSGLTKILTFGADEIPLFHRTPESIPSVEKIEAQVQRIMANKPVEEGDRITRIMLEFMSQNAAKPNRIYVGQNAVKKLCGVGSDKANAWIREHKELLAKHNQGVSPFGANQQQAIRNL